MAITKNSSREEMQGAIADVVIAIEALRRIERLGLATGNTLKAVEDIQVYERQLAEYLIAKG